MCGRFVLFTESLLEEVGAWESITEVHAPEGLPPARYNIAPTQPIAIVRVAEETARVEPARWGLIPHWKKDLDGPPLFNARAETVAQKPSFRDAFKAQRCVIPLDGYYEWKAGEDKKAKKQPYYVTGSDGLLWAAGLWATGMERLSATMVTTDATEEMAWLHHRLPKFLTTDEIAPWLAGEALLEPSSVRGFQAHPADPAVGNVRNDYAELIDEPPAATLF
ncbi:SOS response-associated peptidase [Corynebacterium hiratae]|uniref:Abasic site processing protein n=1 Tax=Corynebacterium aurimucosum TaxID=169292 RepID=A0A6I3KES4_9CORY|nr:SOS response-associated peptidase [Corynebacterium aurimucosum]MTD92520.1 SOS response-associated peptidase [Corynebacterium aurimucosum]